MTYPYLCQLDTPDSDRAELCGETVTAAGALYFGIPTDTEAVTVGIRNQFGEDDIHSGTDFSLLDWWNDQHGVSHDEISFAQVDVELRAGRLVRMLIHDNGNFDPDPRGIYDHYINLVAIQTSGSGYVCHNPGYRGGKPVNYSSAQLQAAVEAVWTIWRDGPAPPAPQPSQPPPLPGIF